jgi:hypothetical protein
VNGTREALRQFKDLALAALAFAAALVLDSGSVRAEGTARASGATPPSSCFETPSLREGSSA